MTRVHLLVTLILYCISSSALSEPVTWLIQGELFTDVDEETSRLVQLETYKEYIPVRASLVRYWKTFLIRDGRFINCVIAAAVQQNGYVDVVEGGPGTNVAQFRYTSKKDRMIKGVLYSDTLFLLVQYANWFKSVDVEGNAARSERLGIAYGPIREWKMEEIQNALRKINATVFPFF